MKYPVYFAVLLLESMKQIAKWLNINFYGSFQYY